MPTNRLEKVTTRIALIKDSHARSALRAAQNYLTDLALRHIVEYILELEEDNGR